MCFKALKTYWSLNVCYCCSGCCCTCVLFLTAYFLYSLFAYFALSRMVVQHSSSILHGIDYVFFSVVYLQANEIKKLSHPLILLYEFDYILLCYSTSYFITLFSDSSLPEFLCTPILVVYIQNTK